MSTQMETPTKDDLQAFYEAQRTVIPDAKQMGLPGGGIDEETPGNAPAGALPEGFEKLEALGETLDTPDHLIIDGNRVTVASPSLDDLINLFKSLQSESANLQAAAKKAEEMAGQVNATDFSGLLKSAPAARTMFLRCIRVAREDGVEKPFASEDEKWRWFTSEIDALDAIDILDMFTDRIDWAKLMTKVRKIMGKLQGLAVTVRQSSKPR